DVDLGTVSRVVEQGLPVELRRGGKPAPPRRLTATAPEPPAPPSGPIFRIEAAVANPELWIAWSLPRAFGAESYLAHAAGHIARTAAANAHRQEADIATAHVEVVSGTQASMLVCRIGLHDGLHPRRAVDRVLDALALGWSQSDDSATKIGLVIGQRSA